MSERDADVRSSEERASPEVPDFDLIRPIGSGGFGEVWLATNRTTGRLRAVKLIPLHTSGNGDPAAREISSITRLEANSRCRHSNLLQIHHVGKTARHLFYVMDPADDISGEPASDKPDYRAATLQNKLDNGPLSPEQCWDYAQQLLNGLAMLHAAGMVHRDVKPANCLFVGGQLKLADFGLLTESHPLVSRIGTQKYMPPDGRMDMRADVYAAGLVIYEMLSGLPVDEFPRLGRQSQSVSDSPILTALLQLVLKACERESAERPANAQAMLAELTAHSETSRNLSQLPRRRWLKVAGVTAVLAAGGAIAWMQQLPRVDVSFVTEPFEARIYLEGELLLDPTGVPYATPCTVDGLPARPCRVAFECKGQPRWEAGAYDLARTQQIVSRRVGFSSFNDTLVPMLCVGTYLLDAPRPLRK